MLTKDRITEVRRHLLEGRFRTFREEALRLLQDPEFALSPPDVRASAYRLAARAELITDGNVDEARRYWTEAKAIADDESTNVLEADIAFVESDTDAALKTLKCFGLDSIKARALYLLRAGRVNEGLGALETVSDGYANDPDLHRILALLRLASGQYGPARREIEQALTLDARHFLIQQAAGIIKFYSCYPPAFLPRQVLFPVDPIPPELLNRDHEHLRSLDEALQHFETALAWLDEQLEPYHLLELWRLAAMAANPDRKAAASEYAETLLTRQPPADQAVQWSKMFDLNAHVAWAANANVAIENKSERSVQRLMLGWLAIEDQHYEEAVSLLMSPSSSETIHERMERKVLLSRALLEQHELDKAVSALEGESGPDVQRIISYIKTVKLQPELEAASTALLDTARKKARDGDWSYVASHAIQLLSDFSSPLSIRLVLLAYFNTKSFKEFLELYNQAATWTGLNDDASVRRAYAMSLWHTNQRIAAVAETKKLFDDVPSANSGRIYAYMLFEGGDTNTIASIVPLVRDATDLTPETALEIAHALQTSHAHEAASLWDKAIEIGIPDDLVAQALGIAYRVGREQETADLVRRMQELAVEGKAGISQANFEQVVELVQHSRAQSEDLQRKYRVGDIPVHALADLEHLPIFVTHYIEPALNRNRSLATWHPIYVRAGNRERLGIDISGRKLLLDVTSLVMAHYVGIIQELLQTAASVVVPAQTTALLHTMYERLSAAQPARVKYVEHVLRAISGRVVTVLPKQNKFEWALNAGGYVVTSIPTYDVKTGAIDEIEPCFQPVAINLRRLVETLHSQQLLSSWERDAAIRILGSEGLVDPIGLSPKRGEKLLFDAAHIELMQEAQLIRPLVNGGYELFITSDTRLYLQSQAQEAARREEAAEKLRALMEEVRDGFGSSKLETRKVIDEELSALDHNAKATASLISSASSDEILVIDDRFMNRSDHTESGATVVSVFDCIAGMLPSAISEDFYYRIVHLARSSGLFFLPLTSSELLYHLARTDERDGVVTETNELRTIRLYLGGALSQPGLHLMRYENYNELAFLCSLDRALRETSDQLSDDSARRDYIFHNLEAAEIATIRERFERGDTEEALRALDALVSRYAS